MFVYGRPTTLHQVLLIFQFNQSKAMRTARVMKTNRRVAAIQSFIMRNFSLYIYLDSTYR